MQVELGKTLDVEVVERQLAELWQQTVDDREEGIDTAVLRARVANLLVFVTSAETVGDVRQMLGELTAVHPSRVLLMFAAEDGEESDIELEVESHCQTDKHGAKRLCCEEIKLEAHGKFVAELPSAALPLLVSDLSTFLWWRAAPQTTNKVLGTLLRATDRLVIDSIDFADPQRDLVEVNKIYDQDQFRSVGISDLNWARLTFWRGLLADFYDVPAYRSLLNEVDYVAIDYATPEFAPESCAPQALLIAGWLASRLGWTLSNEQPTSDDRQNATFDFTNRDKRSIKVKLNRVEREEHKPGRLVQIELRCGAQGSEEPASFVVARSEDNLHILSEARLGTTATQRGRLLPVRNRSDAQLLSREMEILCNDQIYQEALAVVAKMIAPAG